MNHVIHSGITAENPNLESKIIFAGEKFNLAFKDFLLYAFPLGRIPPNQNETKAHSARKIAPIRKRVVMTSLQVALQTIREQASSTTEQGNAFERLVKENDWGKMIMACGVGKTFTSLRIAEELACAGKMVLYMVSSLALMSQAIREWKNDATKDITAFSVCSDVHVGKRKSTPPPPPLFSFCSYSGKRFCLSGCEINSTAGFQAARPPKLKIIERVLAAYSDVAGKYSHYITLCLRSTIKRVSKAIGSLSYNLWHSQKPRKSVWTGNKSPRLLQNSKIGFCECPVAQREEFHIKNQFDLFKTSGRTPGYCPIIKGGVRCE